MFAAFVLPREQAELNALPLQSGVAKQGAEQEGRREGERREGRKEDEETARFKVFKLEESFQWMRACLAAQVRGFNPQYCKKVKNKEILAAGHWWLTPVILVSQEAETTGSQFQPSLGK
jgi:hypothetical protein